jgi:hypothetical protein
MVKVQMPFAAKMRLSCGKPAEQSSLCRFFVKNKKTVTGRRKTGYGMGNKPNFL